MFIFDYNPLLIYLYSPQKEQISLSALFTLLILCSEKYTNEFIDNFSSMCIIKVVQEQRRSDHRIGAPFFIPSNILLEYRTLFIYGLQGLPHG